MNKLGLKWENLVGVTTDGCPNLTGKNVGLLKRMQDKVTEINPEQKLIFLHCIIHQEVLCKSVLKINHVTDVVAKVVNFIRARALNYRQFVVFLEEMIVNMVTLVTRQLSDGSAWTRCLNEFGI